MLTFLYANTFTIVSTASLRMGTKISKKIFLSLSCVHLQDPFVHATWLFLPQFFMRSGPKGWSVVGVASCRVLYAREVFPQKEIFHRIHIFHWPNKQVAHDLGWVWRLQSGMAEHRNNRYLMVFFFLLSFTCVHCETKSNEMGFFLFC